MEPYKQDSKCSLHSDILVLPHEKGFCFIGVSGVLYLYSCSLISLFPQRIGVGLCFLGSPVSTTLLIFSPCLFTGMTVRLWKYVSTFSHLSGERLHQIYAKLKQEQEDDSGVGPSASFSRNGNPFHRHMERQRGFKNMANYQMSEPDNNTGKSEAWKRRRRAESEDHFQGQPPPQRTSSNGIRITDPNSLGILGAGPSDKRLVSEKPFRSQPGGFPSSQGFS